MELDELDHQLLHALEVDARAPFRRIAEVLGVSDQTVARRFRRLSTDLRLRVIGVRDAERLGQESWMIRIRCTPDAADPLARALARRPDTTWIALTSGGTEVVCTIRSRTGDRRSDLLPGRLPRTPAIVEIQAHQLMHRFYGGPSGWLGKSRALTSSQIADLRGTAATATAAPTALTARDEPLLVALERDGRATHAELSRATGRQESSVRRRMDQLLGSGALFVDTQFDMEALGYTAGAILWITVAPSSLDAVGRGLAAHPEVASATATTGHSNLVAVIVCRDTPSLYRYLSEGVGQLDGVQHVECAPLLRVVKQLTFEPQRGRNRDGAWDSRSRESGGSWGGTSCTEN